MNGVYLYFSRACDKDGEDNKISMSNEQLPQKNSIPGDLAQALLSLGNGDEGSLRLFVQKYGIQQTPFDLNSYLRKHIRQTVEGGVRRIEKELSYDRTFDTWKLFIDSGLLTKEILEEGINNSIEENLNNSPDEIETINKIVVKSEQLTYYGPDFVTEFKKDLVERIKEKLGWDINLK